LEKIQIFEKVRKNLDKTAEEKLVPGSQGKEGKRDIPRNMKKRKSLHPSAYFNSGYKD
jgi:hypothetical protein